ncbi:unnamed protein product [Cyprideis torosa]|uniref:Uncharacterized protein n=1 Tax=Cyprideis torosa TaxID=163714 RepID=A0A7R8W4K5_9CRUS|nr:unnamed protein product [Cyprideis torosa]CAG0880733.1 unnamed protein product [Cyprideis torosa]
MGKRICPPEWMTFRSSPLLRYRWDHPELPEATTASSRKSPALITTFMAIGDPAPPDLRGTPLAMLAAQCNKLSSKSPPPLADAAVGKGFHPWKKQSSQPSSGGSNETSKPVPSTTSSPGTPKTSAPVITNSSSTDLYFPPASSAESSILGKLDSASHLNSMYSRMAYESWPFNAAAAAAHSAAIKPDAAPTSFNSSAWWDVHAAGASATSAWLDMPGSAATATSLTSSGYPGSDYTAHLLTSGQHLLQDTYKSMLPAAAQSMSPASPFSLTQPPVLPQVTSPRTQRRYTGRATCDCPNCQEAERLGPAGAHLPIRLKCHESGKKTSR